MTPDTVLQAVLQNRASSCPHTGAPERQTRCGRVRAGSSDVSTASWWSDIFTALTSGNGSARRCGNVFSEKQEGVSCLDVSITSAHVDPSGF